VVRQLHRCAFTLVELLVVIAVVGVLIALLLPAVQASRESARCTRCKNNLRQIALAAISFHDSRAVLPPGRIAPRPDDAEPFACGGREPSWVVHLLPYLEQRAAGDGWNVLAEYESHPDQLRHQRLAVFQCPSRRAGGPTEIATTTEIIPEVRAQCGCILKGGYSVTILGGALGDYAGNLSDPSPGSFGFPTDLYLGGNGTGVLIASRPICRLGQPTDWIDKLRFADITDGLSNTLLVGELHLPHGQLGEFPDDSPLYNGEHWTGSLRVTGIGLALSRGPRDPDATRFQFGSWHPEVCHFALLDGSVRGISVHAPGAVLGALSNRSDGSGLENGL
jgi:prepilin-type N-terminal cleavage/methylation domain-containing protein